MWNKKSSYRFGTVLLFFTLLLVSNSLAAATLDKTQKLVNGQTLVSSQGNFELGFFNKSTPAKWYVGIWYKFSPDVVVWIANHNNPMNDSSSTLAIYEGAPVLIDSLQNMTRLFNASSSRGESIDPIMQLHDSGNLVIKDQNGDQILWQSFDYPSNTMLPGMKIGKNFISGLEWYLSSWKSIDDPSTGTYRYKMDTQSKLEIVLLDGETIIFKTGAWVGTRFSGLFEMSTYTNIVNFNFSSNSSEVSYSFEAHDQLFRVVLIETGELQRLEWDQTSKSWNNFWQWPDNVCDKYAKCGPFGICNPNEPFICKCLPQFNVKSQREWSVRNTSGGCVPKTPLSRQAKGNGFKLVKGVKLPDTDNATVHPSISIKECKRKCSMNSSCLAYSRSDIRDGKVGCITWSNDLRDIRYISEGQDLYIKLNKSDLGAGKTKIRMIMGMIGTCTVLILVSLIVFLIYLRCRKKKIAIAHLGRTKNNDSERGALQGTELPIHDLQTVMAATANFSDANKLGQGGFGIVYKGELRSGEGIAVKRLSKGSAQGLNEFVNEVMLIAKLQHRNLVRLLGCCIQSSERILIYEFMPNKSLDYFIFDKARRESLGWKMRLEIVKGISRGILYLHQDSRFNIIHRDLKAANILLDEEMTPKISDFGIARLFKREQNEMDTERVVGTRGYMSPEYAMEGKISVKSDVYSFGVLLLEITTGKRNQGNHNLLANAWQQWQEGSIINLVDEAIDSAVEVASEIVKFIHVGLLCVQECADDRPTMSTVVSMLANEGLSLPEPKKPVLSTKVAVPEVIDSANELTISAVEGR